MKKLHELLREYITRSGYTIYGLAKESGLNRSTLQKIVLGNMRLSREEMDRILPYLRLTRAEQEHFTAMQELGEKGELVRRRREAMAEFLVDVSEQIYEGMSAEGKDVAEGGLRCGEKEEKLPRQKAGTAVSGQTEPNVKNAEKPDISNTCNTPESVTLLRGKTEIQRSLIRCIAYEYERNGAGKIYASIPADWQLFYTALRAADRIAKKSLGGGYREGVSGVPGRNAAPDVCDGRTEVVQLVRLREVHGDAVLRLLPALRCGLSAAFIQRLNYSSYVYAEAEQPQETLKYPFPYYIAGSAWSLMLDAGGNTALLWRDEALCAHLMHLAGQQRANALPLVQTCGSAGQILEVFSEKGPRRKVYTVSQQPCMLPFLDREQLLALVHPELLQANANLLEELADMVAGVDGELVCAFTEEGAEHFARTGQIDELPPSCAGVCGPQDCRKVLARLRQAAERDPRVRYRALNPNLLPLARNFSLTADERCLTVAGFCMGGQTDYRFAVVDDSALAAAFRDFFAHLTETHLCYSKEETLEILARCIGRIPS